MTGPAFTQTLRAAVRTAGVAGVSLAAIVLTTPAQAQFNWFGLGGASSQDVVDTIAEHGFQLIGPIYRTGRVYVADVIDRRRRRERLIVSAESGQIVQRFFVDTAGPERWQPDRPRPPRDGFFAHLQRGWDDEPPPRPPLALPNQPASEGDASTVTVPRPRHRNTSRVVTRTDVPPAAAPLAPTPSPSGDPGAAKPDVPTGQPSGGSRATTIVNDPLRLPGARKADGPKPSAAPTAVATAKPPEPPPTKPAPAPARPSPAPVKPAPAQPADVPVAPLD